MDGSGPGGGGPWCRGRRPAGGQRRDRRAGPGARQALDGRDARRDRGHRGARGRAPARRQGLATRRRSCWPGRPRQWASGRSDPDKDGPTKFGEQVTLDHIVTLHPDASCYEGMADAVVLKDRATGWVDIFPLADKGTENTLKALRGFLAPGETLKEVWGDGSGEITGACEAMKWPLQRSTPGRPQTNGVAERAVRACLEGTRTILEQSGLNKKWWSRACRHFTLVYNSTAKDEHGTTAWSRRFNAAPSFPLIPFGSLVHYKTGTKKHNAGDNKFGPSSSKGIFLGYYMHDGSKWSKDFLVLDLDQAIANAEKYCPVLRVAQVYAPQADIYFPMKDHLIHKVVVQAKVTPQDV